MTFGWIIDTNLLHLDVMGSHIVALSDSDVAADLIAQRSYSDRVCKSSNFRPLQGLCTYPIYRQPQFPMVNDLYELSYVSSTPTNDHGVLQDGMQMGLLLDALREHLAYPPQAIPQILQHRSRGSIRQ